MARKALVFWLLQFSPLIAAASAAAGTNASLDYCVDFDMANVEDLISALGAVEDPKIDADEGGEKLQPFGHFKSDWSRLNLLQKSLPKDSVLKDKFKHIFRLLTVAHIQRTQAFISSESTKTEDHFMRQSTLSLAKENRTDDRQIGEHPVDEVHGKSLGAKKQEISEIFNTPTTPISGSTQDIRDPSTTSGTSSPNTLPPESKQIGIGAVLESPTEISAEPNEEKEINVAANTTDLKPTIKSSVTAAALIPTLEPLIESSSTAAAPSSTFYSTTESSATTAASIWTSEPLVKSSTAATLLPISSAETTEKMLEYGFMESSTHQEYSSIGTTAESATPDAQTLKSILSKSDSLSPIDVNNMNYSTQSTTTDNSTEQITNTEKYVSARTLSKFEPTENQSIVSVTNDKLLKLLTSSTQKYEGIGLTTSNNNRTEDSLSINSTPIISETTHFVEDVINITSTTEQVPETEPTTEELLIEVLKGKNSITDLRHITNPTERNSSVTPSISDSEQLTTTAINNQTEAPMNEKTTVHGWRGTDPTQSASTTKNSVNNQTNPTITSNDLSDNLGDPTSVTETSELPSHSQSWIKPKPNFEKNPLNIVSSSGNNIVREYKHDSLATGTGTNSDSPQIVLAEIGVGAKTGNDWRPQFKRPIPAGNNIRRYEGFPNNDGPYGYGYGYGQPIPPPANGKSGILRDEKIPVKLSAPGSRKNLVRSRKRGSANADVEKQFGSFYIQHKPRVKESDNAKIKIQCKKQQQPHW